MTFSDKEGLQSHVLLVKPRGYYRVGSIVKSLQSVGIVLINAIMVKLSQHQARQLYELHSKEQGCSDDHDGITSDVSFGIAFGIPDSVRNHAVVGRNSSIDHSPIFTCLRCYEDDIVISTSQSSSNDMSSFFFGGLNSFSITNVFRNCLLCIIKPHVLNPYCGIILDRLLKSGIEISGLRVVQFTRYHAERLLDVYRGVIEDFGAICDHLASGPSMILEVRQEDIYAKMRSLAGPTDPELAKIVAPGSIRADLGVSAILNAIYFTEVEEEGPRECRCAFEI